MVDILEQLVEAGLVEARGIKKGRTYTLSSQIYRQMGKPVDYIRQVGFDPIQQEQMILSYVKNHGRITRKETMKLCLLNEDQASRLLRKLTNLNKLKLESKGRGAGYVMQRSSRNGTSIS